MPEEKEIIEETITEQEEVIDEIKEELETTSEEIEEVVSIPTPTEEENIVEELPVEETIEEPPTTEEATEKETAELTQEVVEQATETEIPTLEVVNEPVQESSTEEDFIAKVKEDTSEEATFEPTASEESTNDLIKETMKELGVEEPINKPKKEKKIDSEKAHKKTEKIKEQKVKEEEPKEKKKTKFSKAAKTRRAIYWGLSIYFDIIVAYLLVVRGYLFSYIRYGFNKRAGLVGFILIVFIAIVNILNLVLIKDTRKIKRKSVDDVLPVIEEAEYIDGHRLIEDNFEELEESEVGKEKEVEEPKFRTSRTIIPINPKETVEDFMAFLNENGLLMDKKTARELLSAIASSKMIIVDEENKELQKKLFSLIPVYFGTEYYYVDLENKTGKNPLYLETSASGLTGPTDFIRGIKAAKKEYARLNFDFIYSVNFEKHSKYLKDVFEFAKNPDISPIIKVGSNTVDIPTNTWFIISTNENEIIPSEVIKYSIRLKLSLKEATEFAESKERKPIEVAQLVDAISEAYEFHYINEDVWKKLDEFYDYLGERGEFFIDNRILRSMERFAAFYLSVDGEESDLVDFLLSRRILLIALNNTYKSKDNDDESLVGIAEKILGADYITNSQELLKKIRME